MDEEFYDRQIYSLGMEAMRELNEGSVFISGQGGLGVEIAKNVILAGVKTVAIQDAENASLEDLASHFYLSEKSIGKNRALESVESLKDLNPSVNVYAIAEPFRIEMIKDFKCLVMTQPMEETKLLEISEFCHKNSVLLIITAVRGVFGYVFNDFGEEFLCRQPKTQRPNRIAVDSISHDEEGRVKLNDNDKTLLGDGEFVMFEGVKGMTEVNGKEFCVYGSDSGSFCIGSTMAYGVCTGGGYIVHIVHSQLIKFKSLKESLITPMFTASMDLNRDRKVLLCFWALNAWLENRTKGFLDICEEVNRKYHWVDTVPVEFVQEFFRQDVVISPTAAEFGGIVSQEILKGISGKFMPIHQFLGIAFLESLQPNPVYRPLNDRYDPYRKVFGNEEQEFIMNLKYFVVGAGAIGCELMKNWAMMGIGCGPNGWIKVTDMDHIEKSNLNRQFLFRNSDIGRPKSIVAVESVLKMNPEQHIEAQTNRVGPESESIYTPDFYKSLDGICNALDSVDGRLYNDEKCLLYEKVLLDSGTEGVMAHYLATKPHITECYGDHPADDSNDVPPCTLHAFPTNITHCALWSKNIFDELFYSGPKTVNEYLKDRRYVKRNLNKNPDDLRNDLRVIEKLLVTERPNDLSDCTKWAILKFNELFNTKIRELLLEHPPDELTRDGEPFWGTTRHLPRPIVYDPENTEHFKFVQCAARLYAEMFGIPLGKIDHIEIELPDLTTREVCDNVKLEIKNICQRVSPHRTSPQLKPLHFEKDVAANGHVDFIAAAANLRAANYSIPPSTDREIKRIAGHIEPAMLTTTAAICGMLCSEIYTVHSVTPKELEEIKEGYFDMEVPIFSFSTVGPAQTKTCRTRQGEIEFTCWDKWILDGNITLNEFIDRFQSQYNLTIDAVSLKGSVIWSQPEFGLGEDRFMNMLMTDIYFDLLKRKLEPGSTFRVLVTCSECNDHPPVYVTVPQM